MNRDVSILVVDSHPVVLHGVKSLFGCMESWNISIESSSENAVRGFNNNSYDIYIFDLHLPVVSGADLARELRRINPSAKILIYTVNVDPRVIKGLIDSGVDAIVSKSSDLHYLLEGVKSVIAGALFYDPVILRIKKGIDSSEHKNDILSPKEMEVLMMICDGKTSREIAASSGTSVNTVETHRKNIFAKLDVRNIAQLMKVSFKKGYINGSL